MDVPEVRLLADAERKPMLRVIRLPEGTVEPAPVAIDRGDALDTCLRRDGWLGFSPNHELWVVPLPFGEKPFLVRKDAHWMAPGIDPATAWSRTREWNEGDPELLDLFDGRTREVRRQVLLAPELSLVHDTPQGVLVWNTKTECYHLLAADGALSPAVGVDGFSLPLRDAYKLRRREGRLMVVDYATAAERPVDLPAGLGKMHSHSSSYSPDGKLVAFGVERTPRTAQPPPWGPKLLKAEYVRRPTMLVIVDCTTCEATLCDGDFDNFNTPAAWTADGSALFFSTPFQPGGIWMTRPSDPRLEWIPLAGESPSPLYDVTDLVP